MREARKQVRKYVRKYACEIIFDSSSTRGQR